MPNENEGWITGCKGSGRESGQKPPKTAKVLAVVFGIANRLILLTAALASQKRGFLEQV